MAGLHFTVAAKDCGLFSCEARLTREQRHSAGKQMQNLIGNPSRRENLPCLFHYSFRYSISIAIFPQLSVVVKSSQPDGTCPLHFR